MSTSLDVLVVENRRRAADHATAELDAAGHRIRRCYEADSRGFPCRAILQRGSCPLDQGVDVALVVRDRIEPRPTRFEVGVSCAIRAGVPIVELGPAALDPFEPWLAHRIADGEDVERGVATTADRAFDGVRRDILDHVRALAAESGDAPMIDCDFERAGTRLVAHLTGPMLGDRMEQAIAVRVRDAICRSGRTYGQVDVTYHHREPPAVS